jgi:hypothetical protein
MNTRPYTDLLGLVEALCGATLAEQERVRIRYFVNRRAQRAYAATELWPRFLVVGEERVVSEGGVLPYEQPALADIGTVLRIHATRPFLADPAREYGEFYASTAGIQITGYDAVESTGRQSYTIDGSSNDDPLIPDVSGDYTYSETDISGFDIYRTPSNPNLAIVGLPSSGIPGDEIDRWVVADELTSQSWISEVGVNSPELAQTWTIVTSGSGSPVVTKNSFYSAYITYKAALTATYGSNAGDTTGFPEEWFEYAAHGAYADFLRNEGKQDKALVAEAEATEILQEQLEKVSRQGGARVATRVMNHANHQSR